MARCIAVNVETTAKQWQLIFLLGVGGGIGIILGKSLVCFVFGIVTVHRTSRSRKRSNGGMVWVLQRDVGWLFCLEELIEGNAQIQKWGFQKGTMKCPMRSAGVCRIDIVWTQSKLFRWFGINYCDAEQSKLQNNEKCQREMTTLQNTHSFKYDFKKDKKKKKKLSIKSLVHSGCLILQVIFNNPKIWHPLKMNHRSNHTITATYMWPKNVKETLKKKKGKAICELYTKLALVSH